MGPHRKIILVWILFLVKKSAITLFDIICIEKNPYFFCI